MMLKNSTTRYGLIAKTIHWLVAVAVLGMFAVGVWMVGLSYYDDWYKDAPHYHKSVGMILVLVMLFRLVWRMVNVTPHSLSNHKPWEKIAASLTHVALYGLLFAIFISGYLISTADGRGIEVFNWFTVPGLGSFIENQEDIAGLVHEWLAYSLIGLVVLHAGAALKHHFIDKDETLKRMTLHSQSGETS